MTPQQERLLKSVDRKLSLLLRELNTPKKEKETWVTAKYIINLTGWNKNDMVLARKNKWIEKRETETGGYEYLLESLNEKFLRL